MRHTTADSAGQNCSCQAMQPTPAHAVGCFKLLHRHALTLTVRAPGELRMAHGQVWVTFANAAQDASVRAGDHFLQPGEVFHLTCGQNVVIEALDARPDAAAYFSWEPNAASSAGLVMLPLSHAEVRQPLHDLAAALHLAGRAFGRLLQGVASSLACILMVRRSAP